MIGITGSSGVLGRILSQKLFERKIPFSAFDGDIRDFQSLTDWFSKDKLTYIIHLASKVAIKDVDKNLSEAYDVNISGTINLVKAINTYNKPIGLFYASSSHVYKSSTNSIKETDLIEPINSYGLTKYVSELVLKDFNENFSKLSLCIGRIFSFYHHTQSPPFLYPNLMKRFENEDLNKPFKLYGANSTRDFLNAEDVCDIILELVAINHKGVVNIASGRPIKIIDFVKSISPVELIFDVDEHENINHLNADITLMNKILKKDE
jgi:nucleoside-diphosphate-sugar epimerase